MKSTEDQSESVLLTIAERLVSVKQELGDLADQLSSGKVEANDKFEEIKNEFRARLSELKRIIQADPQKAAVALVTKIIELETALLSGQVDAKEVFEAQKKNILAAMTSVEDEMIKHFGEVPAFNNFLHEVEKFKLKLEILRLKFVLKKFKIKDAFRSGMDEAVDTVRTAASKVRRARERYRNFRDEVRLAYSHMRKAVKKL